PKPRTEASALRSNLEGLKGTAQSNSHTSVQESSISKVSTGKTSPKTQAANTNGKSTPEVASKDGAHQKAPVKNSAAPQQKSGNSDSPKIRIEASASKANLDGLKAGARKGDSQIGHQAEGKGKKHAVTANDSPKKTDGKVHDNNHPQSGLAGLKKYASKDNKASHTSKGHEANVSASAEGISKLKGSSKITGHQANSSGKSKSSGISKKVDGGMSM
uniref:hypothetical protein n=1 Tax=Halodesulfovibrio sp. TaxID=1912772 RepID=UPI0025BBA3D5